jgi:hypothetical protein
MLDFGSAMRLGYVNVNRAYSGTGRQFIFGGPLLNSVPVTE